MIAEQWAAMIQQIVEKRQFHAHEVHVMNCGVCSEHNSSSMNDVNNGTEKTYSLHKLIKQ